MRPVLAAAALAALAMAGCGPTRPHAAVHYNGGDVRVTPSLHSSIGGLGISLAP